MRHKYEILRDDKSKQLTIREFAVLDRNVKNIETSMLKEDSYTLLCKETYAGEMIHQAVAKGVEDVTAVLRTDNLYPIEPTIAKIAESVIELYTQSKDASKSLYFDDNDFFSQDMP
ncbi:MAG: hypothetical protein LJE65_05240 [Desulfobacteraceae bacterium]|jgi:hypothetical protein|nr:hypothetical protein [Desulfobacteraceae bacterium]